MNRALALLIAALALLLPGGGALAQTAAQPGGWGGSRVVMTASWTEEWDPVAQAWVRVEDGAGDIAPATYHTTNTVMRAGRVTITETIRAEPTRFIAHPARFAGQGAGLAQYGPFRVLDEKRAALVAATDAASPRAFEAMLAAYPGLEVIEFLDAPGTSNDLANLAVGRKIRAAGLATHVPDGGSARSGAVELFLAGTTRTIAPRALFAVHSWRDEAGREPADFAPEAPANRLYLDYYTEMGMGADEARAFYTMTNSVPHASALWLEGAEMARWIAPRHPAARELAPVIDAPLVLAMARPGIALAHAASAHWAMHRAALAAPQPRVAPRLAYANLASLNLALLDSAPAFP